MGLSVSQKDGKAGLKSTDLRHRLPIGIVQYTFEPKENF